MKIFLDSIGCRLNQSEIEKMGQQFLAAGHELVPTPAGADLVVVNTCAVTAAASADSRKKIRSASHSGSVRIVATGCYATIDPQTIAELPSVERVLTNTEKDNLVGQVLGKELFSEKEISSRVPLPGEHRRTRAFIKVQDGCDNFCTFCITRIARGKSRSIPKEEIFKDIESALAGGVKEIVLTGVNLGAWGRESMNQATLGSLIEEIFEKFNPPRLRLSSLEPWDVDDRILRVLTRPNFCQHLHLPLQSGSNETLKKMGRGINKTEYEEKIKQIREVSPDIALTTDVIVGFPGEKEALFEESLDFVRRMNFAGGHVFSFSLRKGTPAERLPDRIQPSIIKNRSRKMREAISLSARKYHEEFIGQEVEVLWERSTKKGERWELRGLSGNYLKIRSISDRDRYNQLSKVVPNSFQKDLLNGLIELES